MQEGPEVTDAADADKPGGAMPVGIRLKWEAASAGGWDAKLALIEDKEWRRRLRKVESKAAAPARAALLYLESLLGLPCGGGGGGSEAQYRSLLPSIVPWASPSSAE